MCGLLAQGLQPSRCQVVTLNRAWRGIQVDASVTVVNLQNRRWWSSVPKEAQRACVRDRLPADDCGSRTHLAIQRVDFCGNPVASTLLALVCKQYSLQLFVQGAQPTQVLSLVRLLGKYRMTGSVHATRESCHDKLSRTHSSSFSTAVKGWLPAGKRAPDFAGFADLIRESPRLQNHAKQPIVTCDHHNWLTYALVAGFVYPLNSDCTVR